MAGPFTTILDKIGAGGMGQVFKAEHRRMKRVVAVKMLPPKVTKDAAAVARFQREVEAAARLRHPNIVAADDADEANGAHFLVMEYVEGKDLSALVKKDGPFPIAKAVNYVLQAARGLEFAHSEGVVHRDIKPANLLLDKKGVVKILDMGLARIDSGGDTAAQAELTGTGAVMGTVDYMAPEQGVSTKNADARADIYSLGCSLHYLLIGKPVYDGETITAKLLAHHHQPIPELRKLRDQVPEKVDAVFRKMVAKKIDNRYQTMSEVVAALEESQSILNSEAASASRVLKPPAADESSEMSLLMQNQKLRRIDTSDPFAVDEPQPKPRGRKNNGPPSKNTRLFIGAGAAGCIALLLGVFFIFRNDKGEEVARVKLPEGGSVEVREEPAAARGQQAVKPGRSAAGATGSASPSPAPLIAPFDAQQAHAGQAAWARHLATQVETVNNVGAKLVLIPPGEFLMGSSDRQVEAALKAAEEVTTRQGEKERIQKAERPQHRVVITKPFLISATEVTIGQFKRFAAAISYKTEAEKAGTGAKPQTYLGPGYAVTDDSPAAVITWSDAVAYCNWLSEQEKATYRLPTEAEWEYACRAGTTNQYSFGDNHAELEQYAWYKKNVDGKSHPVGTRRPNAFNLYDMHGNVEEWCQDFYDEKWHENAPPNDPLGPTSGFERVIRGGGWHANASHCRCAYRDSSTPSYRFNSHGFRYVRVLDGTAALAKTPAEATPPIAKAPFDAEQAKTYQAAWAGYLGANVRQKNPIGITLVLIPPGEFLMGSTAEQNALGGKMAEETKAPPTDSIWNQLKAEVPQHRVLLTKPCWLGMTEITIGQFKKFVEATRFVTQAEQFGLGNSHLTKPDDKTTPEMKNMTWRAPGYAVTDESPVTQVTWNDAVQFCNWLSDQEKLEPCYRQDAKDGWILVSQPLALGPSPTRGEGSYGYRLPTEAEWEYACRAGTTTQFSFGDDPAMLDIYGWCNTNSSGSTHAVGSKVANPFGLFDMHGNAYEWCHDFYAADYYSKSRRADPWGPSSVSNHVGRGGYYRSTSPVRCRSACRDFAPAVLRRDYLGFRVVRLSRAPAGNGADGLAIGASTTSNNTIATPNKAGRQWVFDDWKALFDGKSLAGWTGQVGLMAVESGVLVNEGKRGVVVAPGDYQACEIELEFRLAIRGNSGLGILYSGRGVPSTDGLEIQLLDDDRYPTSPPEGRCGSIYDLAASKPGHFKAWPEWNVLRVRSLGPEVQVDLNGILVTNISLPILQRSHPDHPGLTRNSGRICLLPHTGRSEYRNFRVRMATWTAASSAK